MPAEGSGEQGVHRTAASLIPAAAVFAFQQNPFLATDQGVSRRITRKTINRDMQDNPISSLGF
jgi:hypothetical protein